MLQHHFQIPQNLNDAKTQKYTQYITILQTVKTMICSAPLLVSTTDHHVLRQPTHLLIVPKAGVAGDGEELQQIHAVVPVLAAHSSLQQRLPVVVIPTRKEGTESSRFKW